VTYHLHVGDAVDHLRRLPAASVDCVITDPPYGATNCSWDSVVDGWLPEVRRLLKPTGSLWVFGSMRFLLLMAESFKGWKFAQDIVWQKHNGSCAHADRFRRVHEHALQFYPAGRKWGEIYKAPIRIPGGKQRIVRRSRGPDHHSGRGAGVFISAPGGMRLQISVLKVQSMHRAAIHPTQKPEGIMVPLVVYSCPRGGVVLDPFAGSGTTGVVSIRYGRSFIGCELNPEYAAMADKRLAAAYAAGVQERIEGVA
jgi:site-specific DNA-methyltransferase (adenine-specific)